MSFDTVLINNADAARMATEYLVEKGHKKIGYLKGSFRIRTVVIEDIHIVQMHALQALVEAGNQVFAAAVIAVRAGPHIVARFGADDHFVAVRLHIARENATEICFRRAGGRAVVVGDVKMCNAVVKGGKTHLTHGFKIARFAKVVPKAQGHRRQF